MAMKSSSKLYMEDIFITGILRDKCNIELKFVLQILNDYLVQLIEQPILRIPNFNFPNLRERS